MATERVGQMALELGKTIAQTEVMEALEAIRIKLSEDPEASALMSSCQEARSKMENKIRDGLEIMPEEEKDLEVLQQKFKDNESFTELNQLQEQLNNLMQSVFCALNQGISGENCSLDCGNCGRRRKM